MPSQNNSGVPVIHAPDGVGYRLMELPPELLEALESSTTPELRLESSATSAVLKLGTQSWALRQKNTSNALILLKAGNVAAASVQIPQPGLQVVSTIHDTIELIPEPSNKPATTAKGKWHERFAKGR
ncbi:hypothetical protein NPX13_g2019 [Xylaria arbuscula]|uniref:Sister chromatid cohesion protein DCC1 n=1 Tax=Xylaria arbuscula TaxID=114810 RepID=A0A9W8TQT1_9PEZI|nr:hypothetical protein NPX13_g2019 [Xylaria arbuscula]